MNRSLLAIPLSLLLSAGVPALFAAEPAPPAANVFSVVITAYGGRDDCTGESVPPACTNNADALRAIKARHPKGIQIDLPLTGTGIYFVSGLPPGFLDGFTFNPAAGVSVANVDGSLGSGLQTTRRLDFYCSPIKIHTRLLPGGAAAEDEKSRFLDNGAFDDAVVEPVDCRRDLEHESVAWPAGSGRQPCVPTVTANSVRMSAFEPGVFGVSYARAEPGTELSAVPTDAAPGTIPLFIGLRLVDGGLVGAAVTPGNAAVLTPVLVRNSARTPLPPQAVPAGDTHSSYWLDRSLLTLRLHTRRSFSVLANGVEVYFCPDTGSDIDSAGFGSAGGSSLTWSHWTRTRHQRATGHGFKNGIVFGDSISAPGGGPGRWPDYFRQAVEFSTGVRLLRLDNYAVGGHASPQQLAVMRTVKLDSYDFALILVGTNNIQYQSGVAGYVADLNAMLDCCLAANPRMTVVLGVPPLFYTRAQAEAFGGQGQNSQNYDRGAAYRAALLEVAATRRIKVALGTLEELGPVVANLLQTPKDPVVNDNIHGGAMMNRLLGYAFAKAYLGAINPVPSQTVASTPVPAAWTTRQAACTGLAPAAGGPVAYRIAANGEISFSGFVRLTSAPARGTATHVLTLPMSFRPGDGTRHFACPATDAAGAPVESALVTVGTDGRVTVQFPSTTPTGFYLDNVDYHP